MLREHGYEVQWVPEIFNGDPGDEVIIDKAIEENYILITGDKDFGEWIFLRGKAQPPLVRLAAMSPINQKDVVEIILKKYMELLNKGALITANKKKIRIRR
jgi:predicted nuclease of predicted toxin-antitoxin system